MREAQHDAAWCTDSADGDTARERPRELHSCLVMLVIMRTMVTHLGKEHTVTQTRCILPGDNGGTEAKTDYKSYSTWCRLPDDAGDSDNGESVPTRK